MNPAADNRKGIVYVLSNRSLWLPPREQGDELTPIVKIGRTAPPTAQALQKRMSQLFATGVVLPFDLEYAKAVADCHKAERKLHRVFAQMRVSPTREFFCVNVEAVVEVLELYDGQEVTLDGDELSKVITQKDIDARNKQQPVAARGGKFSFDALGIPMGAELVSTYSSDKTARVVQNGEVEYDGEILTIHAAAKRVQHEVTADRHRITGSTRWKYQGVTLHNRQKKFRENNRNR